MDLHKDSAVVLRRLDYSETSQILVVFTRGHGKQRLIAKGIKRSTKTRVAVAIDLLESGEVVWSRREGGEASLGTLTDWRQVDAFTALRRDLSRLYTGQYTAEIVSLLTEDGDAHPALFDRLTETLTALGKAGSTIASVVAFQIDLLREVGSLPDFDVCANCREPLAGRRAIHLAPSEGGFVCRDCEPAVVDKRRVSVEAMAGLTGGAWTDAGRLDAFEALDYHIRCLVGRATRLASFVMSSARAHRR
jgi:DNA repair protein RecO (recombination protein O)